MLDDRVERSAGQLAVVGHPDLDLLAEAGLRDLLARELGLRGRERDAGDASRRSSLAAWIAKLPQPQPTSSRRMPGCRSSLLAIRSSFASWASSSVCAPLRVDRAAVGHRLVEEQREELVADVVVVADRGRVALQACGARRCRISSRLGRLGIPPGSAAATTPNPRRALSLALSSRRLPFVDHDERRRRDRRPPASRPRRRVRGRACRAPGGSATAPTAASRRTSARPRSSPAPPRRPRSARGTAAAESRRSGLGSSGPLARISATVRYLSHLL